MSRAKHPEHLNAVQLFPFVAVLLCTMGSLLIILVSVARSSKVRAVETAAAEQVAARAVAAAKRLSPAAEAAAKKELGQIAAYQSQLDTVRTRAAAKLREDQLRLSHLEDHMQRLREQLDSLKLSAAELNSLEGEHYDDRKQAQREVERLGQLIADSRKTIDELRAEMKRRPKSYAIVPYQGHRGTFRRPIYIECCENEVILQPEGVKLTMDDFRPPIGPGNPLVAAIRAAREYIMRYESNAAAGKEAEPYPLIIVRPKGVPFYYGVREAIQSWDSEFGYELVEEDWELKYSPADPQLASLEYQAADLARNRLRALAASAPQAYGAYRSFDGGDEEGGDERQEVASRHVSHGGPQGTGRRGGGGAFVVVDRGEIGGQPGGECAGCCRRKCRRLRFQRSSRFGRLRADSAVVESSAGPALGGPTGGNQSSMSGVVADGSNGGSGTGGRPAAGGMGSSSGGASGGVKDGGAGGGAMTDDRYASKDPKAGVSPNAPQSGQFCPRSLGPAPEGAATVSVRSAAKMPNDNSTTWPDTPLPTRPARAKNTTGRRKLAARIGPSRWRSRHDPDSSHHPNRVREDALAILPEQSATKDAAATGREFPLPRSAGETPTKTRSQRSKLGSKIGEWQAKDSIGDPSSS